MGIVQPVWEFLSRGGKRWRSILIMFIAEIFEKDVRDMLDLCVLAELLHNGSLIVDDIEDSSERRRGQPCLHLIKGIDIALNAGNFLYFLPFKAFLERTRTRANDHLILKCYDIFFKSMVNLHLGQGLDIFWHSKLVPLTKPEPSIEEYITMCACKTGALSRMISECCVVLCEGSAELVEAFGNFAESIGVAFQIKDDILNLIEGDKDSISSLKGGIGEDIHEAKRSLMVIHCFYTASASDVKRLKEILAMRTTEEALIKEAIEIIKRNGCIEFAQKKAKEMMKQAWESIDGKLEESAAKRKLKLLVQFMVERDV